MEEKDNLDILTEAINKMLSTHGINVQASPLAVLIGFAVLVFIALFCVPACITHAKRHKNATEKYARCTHTTTGKIIELIKREVYIYKDDGSKDWNYEYFAKIAYLDCRTIYLLQPISHYNKSITDAENKYKVGYALQIWYDPKNPNDAIADVDMKEGLKTKWYVGILETLGAFAIFATIAFGIMYFTGYFQP
jgi:hypothetical protein